MDTQPRERPQRIVVRRSRVRAAVLGSLSLALCLVAIRFAWGADVWIERLFAGSMALFLGVVAILTILLAVDRTPVLELDEEGVIDRGSLVRAGRIRWQDVRRVEARESGGRRVLLVQVYRPQRFAADLDPEHRRSAEELIQRYGTPIVIPWEALDRPLDQVVAYAEALRRGMPPASDS
ncbi:hypothetical protein OO015_07645 [Thermomicrobium sp. 4228-Ro]|uniref:STM3941 family protein n=1 Tax=Thermomicrobium sp. 4228-Ro TaxID=2993937 RepID=UPI002249410F|nr:STM3941 family protein [Thermomicrobium sp. 4228-Ro]MCX2727371.1 hypothetical protein [Thermomicrobium sp. 4228-Ro]